MDVLDDDDEKDANRRQVKRRPQQLSTMLGQQAKQPRELIAALILILAVDGSRPIRFLYCRSSS